MAWNSIKRAEWVRKKLAALPQEVVQAVALANAENAKALASDMRAVVAVDQGVARDTIQVKAGATQTAQRVVAGGEKTMVTLRKGAKTDGSFDNKYDYVLGLEFGVRPHSMRGQKSVGAKSTGGFFASATGIKHPGAKAQPFFFSTYRASKKKMTSKVTRRANAAIKKVAG